MTFPEQPDNGDQPQVPQVPQVPEVPTAPQVPAEPQAPEAPQFEPQATPVPPVAPPSPQYGQPQYQAPQQPQYQPPQQPHYQAQQQYDQQQYAQQGAVGYGTPGPGQPFNGAATPEDLARPLYGASFAQAIRRFFKNYVNFKGRASRSEYWWASLFLALMTIVPSILYGIGLSIMFASNVSAGYSSSYSTGPSDAALGLGVVFIGIGGILLLVLTLGTLLPSIAIIWRRLHDANLAGPFFFISFVPYLGSLALIVLTILGSKPEGRRFDEV